MAPKPIAEKPFPHIKEVSKETGFARGLAAGEILGVTSCGGQLTYFMTWFVYVCCICSVKL